MGVIRKLRASGMAHREWDGTQARLRASGMAHRHGAAGDDNMTQHLLEGRAVSSERRVCAFDRACDFLCDVCGALELSERGRAQLHPCV